MVSFILECSALVAENANIFVSVLLAGLIGSLTHCSAMCGAIVASQISLFPENHSVHRTMSWYHAGRITTYIALGVVACVGASWIFGGTLFPVVTNAALLLAGLLFIASAIRPKLTHACAQCQSSSRMLDQLPEAARFYLRGMLMGFMPCGLVLAVLLLLSTTHNPVIGGVGMALFGLTTVPVLQIVSVATRQMARKYQQPVTWLGRGVMSLNGIILCLLGMNIL